MYKIIFTKTDFVHSNFDLLLNIVQLVFAQIQDIIRLDKSNNSEFVVDSLSGVLDKLSNSELLALCFEHNSHVKSLDFGEVVQFTVHWQSVRDVELI